MDRRTVGKVVRAAVFVFGGADLGSGLDVNSNPGGENGGGGRMKGRETGIRQQKWR